MNAATIEFAWSAAWALDQLDEALERRSGREAALRRRRRLEAVLGALARREASASVISRLSPADRPLREEQVDQDLTLVYERRPGGIRVVMAFSGEELQSL